MLNPPQAQGQVAYLALHTLGWKAFQDLCSQVCAENWEVPVSVFREAQDGGQDAVFMLSKSDGKATAIEVAARADRPWLSVDGWGRASGRAGQTIWLPRVDAGLRDRDGSETLSLQLLSLPAGTVVTDGHTQVQVGTDGQGVSLDGFDSRRLRVTVPAHISGNFELTVVATSTENSNGDTATTSERIDLTVREARHRGWSGHGWSNWSCWGYQSNDSDANRAGATGWYSGRQSQRGGDIQVTNHGSGNENQIGSVSINWSAQR